MNMEDLLRETLGRGSDRGPSPDFEDRVTGSLTPRGRRRVSLRLEVLAAVAAAIAILAVLLPSTIGPRNGFAGPEASASGSAATASGGVTPSPTAVSLAHAKKWFLDFDYPAAWTLSDQNVLTTGFVVGPVLDMSRYVPEGASMGFVGSGSAHDQCVATGSFPAKCLTQWNLPSGSVVVRFWVTVTRWNGFAAINGVRDPGYTAVTVDGLPALFAKSTSGSVAAPIHPMPSPITAGETEVIPGADEILSWVLPGQFDLTHSYWITAAIRGPNIAEQEAQVMAMMAGLHWDPAPYMLPTAAAALESARTAAAATGLTQLRTAWQGKVYSYGNAHVFDCFPAALGAKLHATITSTQRGPLTKPLPVTCSTDIAPNAMQGWSLTLIQSWAAGSGHAAGQYRMVYDLAVDGTVIGMDQTQPDFISEQNAWPGLSRGRG